MEPANVVLGDQDQAMRMAVMSDQMRDMAKELRSIGTQLVLLTERLDEGGAAVIYAIRDTVVDATKVVTAVAQAYASTNASAPPAALVMQYPDGRRHRGRRLGRTASNVQRKKAKQEEGTSTDIGNKRLSATTETSATCRSLGTGVKQCQARRPTTIQRTHAAVMELDDVPSEGAPSPEID